ncbi:Neuropeptide-Like Protein [Caenorhabditis elegans]|uniref:Neuropeptide-Like Protein n=1 Tax=Caenorhabditis elegans TaxID=6239 RepID=A0A3B1E9Z4_CAEEL|nr:Neuropeptide-Like Protein [Caenorhabditis elegans]VAY52525.1 Neuropeptide-Like Protein [Caenorhabditis elegans]|eukprot:NP_001355441.1 Uncharacterized protein CELE_F26F2.11 [Caenorhabditis elegans]
MLSPKIRLRTWPRLMKQRQQYMKNLERMLESFKYE